MKKAGLASQYLVFSQNTISYKDAFAIDSRKNAHPAMCGHSTARSRNCLSEIKMGVRTLILCYLSNSFNDCVIPQ